MSSCVHLKFFLWKILLYELLLSTKKKLISEPLSLQSTCFTDMIYLLTTLLLIMMIYISLQFLGVFKHLHELTIQLNLSHRDTRPNSRNEYTVQVQLRYCYVGMHYWF